ncbi:hypothetical protein GH714_033105 [Hevea brasiliensis]|uniref:Uncharacterized protein n=1 Tax=Hevea brasiliensis TaxID=3981 RepID=A0A6A6M4Y8_HEVBR|nr:hypothetical protein GH714_033105 [Hevea brasiliensis]
MLKDVLYDAEDVVDEFECEALRRKAVKSALKSDFGLTEQIFDRHVIHREREMTHSIIDASNVIGREQARDNVIETLLRSVDGENVSIIPLVGIGDQLQRTLRGALNGRKYLLILEDVWSEDPRKWLELKTLLMGGAEGSKIIVTTRSQRVAEVMGTVSTHNLSLLSHQDCLSLFFKCAFKGQQGKQNSNLKIIGEEIVNKCKGVPLAVITLGSLLYSVTEREWEFIRDNEIWKLEQKEDDILATLRLSYEHLPSYLKRCFAYCSIFPKDYEMDDIELVYLWMAYGLVQSSNENQELEDIGFRYFKELCSRCFFQDLTEYGGNVKCKMHDLIHDLALSVTQNECSMVRTSTQQIPKSVRHISFPYPQSLPNDLPESLQNLDRVRTIWSINERGEGISSEVFIKKFLKI